jgi:predicted nucleic acid-binding protein
MATVVDASVAAKWFLPEIDAERAIDLFETAPLHAPAIIQVEVASAITRRFRMGGITEAEAGQKCADARDVLKWPTFVVTSHSELLERASAIAIGLRHPLADCLYIADAERLGADLLTADPTFAKRAALQFPFVRLF